MSDLVPSVVPLSAGLSLQVPKLLAPPGSLTDVLNYEQVDLQGQKRIDGYVRYDGGRLSALDDFAVIAEDDVPEDYTVAGGLIVSGSQVVAVLLDVVAGTVHVAPINENLMPPYTLGRNTIEDPEQHYQLLLTYMNTLRVRTEQLPGAVAGLHWFRDRLYAVADLVAIPVEENQYTPNQIIQDSTGENVTVLDVIQDGDRFFAILSTMHPERFDGSGTAVLASFFESRSEQQVYTENEDRDFGWRFKHLGWEVDFRNGLSLYGGLPALNQNLGAIGSGWSATGGNNGSPLVLTQDVNISNDRPQVNGWKNSNTPSTYGLSPSNITALDSTYIYADAYMSWDGESRAITVAKDNLTEYPPTATVEVDIP